VSRPRVFFGERFRYLTGGVITWDESGWKSLDEFEGGLQEFFLLGNRLILCNDKGFGGWDHVTGTRSWWKESTACPFQYGLLNPE